MTIVYPPINPAEPTAYRTLSLTKMGCVLASAPLDARDDTEALSLAEGLARGAGVDLWDGLRFIAHFGPRPDEA